MGVTLKELAASLGLSPTTVSRALERLSRGQHQDPPACGRGRARGELPPQYPRQEPGHRAVAAIGHVIPISTSHEIVNPIFADFIAGAGEVYSRAGYDMMLSVVARCRGGSHLPQPCRARDVDGLMVHGPRLNDDRIALLHDLGLPFMVHGRSSGVTTPYSWLDINNRRSFRRATEFLLDLGHRRIALVNGLESMDFAMRRRGLPRRRWMRRGMPLTRPHARAK